MKFIWRSSIRHKLSWIVVATTFVALLLAGTALVVFDLSSYRRSFENDLMTQADVLGQASTASLVFDDAKSARENLQLLQATPNISSAAVYNASGELFATYGPAGDAGVPPWARGEGVIAQGRDVLVSRRIMNNGEVAGTVFLRARLDQSARLLHYLAVLGAVLAASLVAALLLSHRLVMLITRPLVAIGEVAQKIVNSKDFSLRAEKISDDEVGSLAEAFNNMLNEIARQSAVLERSSRALRENEERYQLAVRGSGVGLWDWNMSDNAAYFSPRFKELLGYAEHEFPGKISSMFDALHPDDQALVWRSLDAHFASQQAPHEVEHRLRTRSGEYRWFFVRGEALRDADGKPFRMAGSIIDVTERRAAQEETMRLNAELEDRVRRRTAQLEVANKELEAFSYSASHDLRGPLNAIDGFSSQLQNLGVAQLGERHRHHLERIRANAQYMGQLIDALLKLAQVTRANLNRVPVDIGAIAASALDNCREREPHRRALTTVQPDMANALGDAVLIKQVLENLVGNAWKFSARQEQAEITVGSQPTEQRETAYFVRDNGAGFDMAYAHKLFGSFQRLHTDAEFAGTGIGLATVHRIVGRHNGRVWAESAPGQGATFYFTLGRPET